MRRRSRPPNAPPTPSPAIDRIVAWPLRRSWWCSGSVSPGALRNLLMRGAPDAYPFPTFSAPLRFAIALAAVSIVFGVDAVSGAPVDDAGKFLLLGIAVLASAWFAGTGPALAATVLGAVLGTYEHNIQPNTEAFISLHLALFVVQGLLLTAV